MAKTIYTTAAGAGKALIKIIENSEKQTKKACINTVNIQAAITRKNFISNLNKNLILRNKFTENSVRYTSCPKNTTRYEDIQSTVGALERANYLERQEEGGIHKPKSGTRLAIATDAARTGKSKNRLVSKMNRLNTLRPVSGQFSNMAASSTSKSRVVARAYVASQNPGLVVHTKNYVFRIKKFNKGGSKIFTEELLYSKKYTQTTTPAKPSLKPAAEQPAKDVQKIFNQQMDIITSEGFEIF